MTVLTTATPSTGDGMQVLSPERYVFLDTLTRRVGECIRGVCAGGTMIDFPTYRFNPASGELRCFVATFQPDDGLLLVYGAGLALGGAAGGGASTRLTGVRTLPFEQEGVRIESLTADGRVSLVVHGEPLSLKPGERWEKVSEETQVQEKGVLRLRITETIFHRGILEKAKIILPVRPTAAP